ncbi:MAG: AI-2E family transporter [Firmicutes bacterium]|jgi:sporulation integral membrane protein YtvI|nr:AI-2E family transporter [Bacillota bacterium]MDH7495594.1 AI-2E family transporter [Bacillota bacterium]
MPENDADRSVTPRGREWVSRALPWLLHVLLVAAVALFLFRVRAVLAPFVLALGLSYLMNPLVTYLEKRGAPRSAGTLVVYVGFTLCVTLVGVYLFPRLLTQLETLTDVLPEQAQRVQARLVAFYTRFNRFNIPEPLKGAVDDGIRRAEEGVADFARRFVSALPGLLPKMTMLILVPVLAFYFTMDFPEIKMWLLSWIPSRWRSEVVGLLIEVDQALGSFVRGQILVSAVVGVLIFLGLSIIGVDFALVIGIVAGIFNIVPYFGPVIGAIPAVISALLESPVLVIYVIILFVLVNQLESAVVGPNILGEQVGLHPVAVIFSVLAGGHLFGVTGILLAVPAAAVVKVILRYLHDRLVS